MKAALYNKFQDPINVQEVDDPHCRDSGVIIQVMATGICRSDWWGWMGNDPDIRLPHVPGHEFAGIVIETGSLVKRWGSGDRVTVPFVGGCGHCNYCQNGNQQVCDNQFQPGFTAWGSFAQYVAVDYADENLVRLPDEMTFSEAASLGCRFITSFRALVDQAGIKAGEWLAVHGCGGIGLSAIQIGNAMGAHVIAIDISTKKAELAQRLGAAHFIQGSSQNQIIKQVRDITGGGAHVSMDAIGSSDVAIQSLLCLQKMGRHIQVGLLEGQFPTVEVPINIITGNELQIIGSHGMQAHRYGAMFELIESAALDLGQLISDRVSLEDGARILMNMEEHSPTGIAVIEM